MVDRRKSRGFTYRSSYSGPFRRNRDNIARLDGMFVSRYILYKRATGMLLRSAEVPQQGENHDTSPQSGFFNANRTRDRQHLTFWASRIRDKLIRSLLLVLHLRRRVWPDGEYVCPWIGRISVKMWRSADRTCQSVCLAWRSSITDSEASEALRTGAWHDIRLFSTWFLEIICTSAVDARAQDAGSPEGAQRIFRRDTI
jgi:hypothetical protein